MYSVERKGNVLKYVKCFLKYQHVLKEIGRCADNKNGIKTFLEMPPQGAGMNSAL